MSDLLLPQGARLTHIGPHKTGSTAIQHAMHASRERLSKHGVHYAGADFRPRRAGWAIVGGRAPVGRPAPRLEDWDQLVADVEGAGDLRVCISNEDFARATPEESARIVEGLGGDRAHVVAVVRRLDKAELVRALSVRFHAKQWPEWSYGKHVQGGLVNGLLARPRPADHDPLPGLPPSAAPRLEKLSLEQADAVRTSGVRVIGDPERLVTPREHLRVEESPEPPAVDLETATQALEGLLGKAILMHDRQRARQRRALERAAKPGKGQVRSVSDLSGRELLGAGLRRAAARLNGR